MTRDPGKPDLRPDRRHLFVPVGAEAIVLHHADATVYGLNEVSTRVWQLLTEGHGLGSIVETIVGEYEVDRETCERDVIAVLDDLERRGLVTVEPLGDDPAKLAP